MSEYQCPNCHMVCPRNGHYDVILEDWKCESVFLRRQLQYVGENTNWPQVQQTWMTLTPPKTYYVDLPPDPKFTTDELEMGIEWLIEAMKCIVKAWHTDIASDPMRLRFSLLEPY